MKKAVISLILFYKRSISPHFKPCCRFVPVCSSYAIEAVNEHGVLKGLILTALRVLRCNPLFKGGYDPVPPSGKKTAR